MITGTVFIDLTVDSDKNDRRAAGELYAIPAGARAVLMVENRQFPSYYFVRQAEQFVSSVHFDVTGSVAAVAAWVPALRGDDNGLRLAWSS